MPATLKLKLRGDAKQKHGFEIGSLLQGVMMGAIDGEYADQLHESNLHSYSQYITEGAEGIEWTISVLDQEAKEKILQPLSELEHIALRHRNEKLDILERNIIEEDYRDLIEKYYMVDGDPYIHLRFVSPTSFKVQGEYSLYPTARLIFRNLINRYDEFSKDSKIYDRDLLDYIDENVILTGYNMRSICFPLEGVNIPAFMGSIRYKVRGPRQMANILRLLAYFGEYSGVGIKTGIGMGGMKVIKSRDGGGRR